MGSRTEGTLGLLMPGKSQHLPDDRWCTQLAGGTRGKTESRKQGSSYLLHLIVHAVQDEIRHELGQLHARTSLVWPFLFAFFFWHSQDVETTLARHTKAQSLPQHRKSLATHSGTMF